MEANRADPQIQKLVQSFRDAVGADLVGYELVEDGDDLNLVLLGKEGRRTKVRLRGDDFDLAGGAAADAKIQHELDRVKKELG